MNELLMLSEAQTLRLEPHFPLSHGTPRVDDRRVFCGILFVFRNGLRWRDGRPNTGRTGRSTTASSVGAGWACSTASSRNYVRATAPTN
jgi:hypothetical protein